ncbi:MAG TPA: type I phosphomannose isomerase catalytic subunit, partial [Flavobacteriaceae bacterium]|nr:type I phosphomannose isomerase catalytic subunit [Flavobacteriaceae bacterium]
PDMQLYPILCISAFKEKVWGGDRLKTVLGKNSADGLIGESWEISGVEGTVSQVANGFYQGKSINELIQEFQGDFVGKKVYEKYGNRFPLLFKFIDAREDLSVQLHPDDEIAGKRHNTFGKTEMWYVLDTEKDAELIIGFNQKVDKQKYLKHLEENTLETILHREKVKPGDVFYITPGRVHAIGGGVLLAEIQQASDITYRIYDWNRPDIDGKMRELHNDLAIDIIDFEDKKDYKKTYSDSQENLLVSNPYFSTTLLQLKENLHRNLEEIDSFVVYMCVSGEGSLLAGGVAEKFVTGQSILIPATVKAIELHTQNAKLLEVFVP